MLAEVAVELGLEMTMIVSVLMTPIVVALIDWNTHEVGFVPPLEQCVFSRDASDVGLARSFLNQSRHDRERCPGRFLSSPTSLILQPQHFSNIVCLNSRVSSRPPPLTFTFLS